MRQTARILGLDPGLKSTGWAIVDLQENGRLCAQDWGVITTKPVLQLTKTMDAARRCEDIRVKVGRLLDDWAPNTAALEAFVYFGESHGKNFSAMQTPNVIGVLRATLGAAGLLPAEYTTQRIKSTLTRSARSTKQDVARTVKAILRLAELPSPMHASDALACAICHHARGLVSERIEAACK